jgi:tetratricopeptide (TPR) repeat protein
LLYRGIIFLESGKPLEALNALNESLLRNPDSIQTLNIKGNVLKELKKLEDALACYDMILKKAGDVPLAHYGRATVLALQGNARDAVKALSEASSRDQHFLDQAWEDPAFDNIRQNPNFLQLIRVRNVT